MGDILGIVVLIVIYMLAVQGKKKSAAAGKSKQKATRVKAQKPKKETSDAPAVAERKPHPDPEEVFGHEGGPRCHAPGVHLHEVTQQQMQEAGEGEDPCHAGMAVAFAAEDSPVYDSPLDRESPQEDEWARQMLTGVIMSEILTRPCDRRMHHGV